MIEGVKKEDLLILMRKTGLINKTWPIPIGCGSIWGAGFQTCFGLILRSHTNIKDWFLFQKPLSYGYKSSDNEVLRVKAHNMC